MFFQSVPIPVPGQTLTTNPDPDVTLNLFLSQKFRFFYFAYLFKNELFLTSVFSSSKVPSDVSTFIIDDLF